MRAISYPHIELREDGTADITATQTRALEVVLDRLANHWAADEIQRQHPHLKLSEIDSALAYYHDHQDEIDRATAERLRLGQDIRASLGASPLRARLQAKGLVP